MLKKRNGHGNSRTPSAARPMLTRYAPELQRFGSIVKLQAGLGEKVCAESVERLNQILSDTISLRDMYKKHHWQVVGPTFYQLHLLFDKHYEEQNEIVDLLAERIQLLGGISVAMSHDVAERTRVPRPPMGREEPPVQITRLIQAHEVVIQGARAGIEATTVSGDLGTNDLLMSDVLRENELQVWFLSEHLVHAPLEKAQ
jgi:starvation-inducible DNA-binding protein